MSHIHLYRARKQYRELVRLIAEEAARRLPDVALLEALRLRRDAARDRAAEIQLEIDMGGEPAWQA